MAEAGELGEAVMGAIGGQLRKYREAAGLSQSQLAAKVHPPLHTKTLATYEQGIRQITVARLVSICQHLPVTAADLVGEAVQHGSVDLQDPGRLHVDLKAIATDLDRDVRDLRGWARRRMQQNTACTIVRLTPEAIEDMAAALGRTPADLVEALDRYAPA